jgi:hypothetical protein
MLLGRPVETGLRSTPQINAGLSAKIFFFLQQQVTFPSQLGCSEVQSVAAMATWLQGLPCRDDVPG